MKKKFVNILLLGCLIVIPSLFNSCGNGRFESVGNELGSVTGSSTGTGGGVAAAVARCESARRSAYSSTYYPFLKTNCAVCHATGPGSGFFAAPGLAVAYGAFVTKGEAKVYEYATGGGSPGSHGGFGAAQKAVADGFRGRWTAAQSAYDSCIAATGETNTSAASIPVPSKFTVAKSFTVTGPTAPVTMSWNTETEMLSAAQKFNGGTFSMILSVTDLGAGQGLYEFRNPRFVNANPAGAALLKGIAVKVDGTLIPGGTTFYDLERYIPNLAGNNSRTLTLNAGGAITFAAPINVAMNISVGFSILELANFTFDPPTFQTLSTNGGIFVAKCQGCHGNQGGLNMTTYNNVVGSVAASNLTIVSKWSLETSELYRQTEGGFMPTSAPLTQPEKDRVRDWILDGAPNTAADRRP